MSDVLAVLDAEIVELEGQLQKLREARVLLQVAGLGAADTPTAPAGRREAIARAAKRRQGPRTDEQKRAILAELSDGTWKAVSERHGLSTATLSSWKKSLG